MTTEEAKRRIERLERAVDEIHAKRWAREWPDGHPEREGHKPRWLRKREAVASVRTSDCGEALDC